MKLLMEILVVVTLVERKEATSQEPLPPGHETKTTLSLSADEQAARSAKYSFSSDIDDNISDLRQHRDEQRDGLKVTGSYSYSDGFNWRNVVYEADEHGYRVLSDEMVPLDGPNVNPDGSASVYTVVDGAETNYTLTTPQKKTPMGDPSLDHKTLTTPYPLNLSPNWTISQ